MYLMRTQKPGEVPCIYASDYQGEILERWTYTDPRNPAYVRRCMQYGLALWLDGDRVKVSKASNATKAEIQYARRILASTK